MADNSVPSVVVGDSHRTLWKETAKKGIAKWGVKTTAYNQDANALTMASIARDIMTKNEGEDVMVIVKALLPYFKICGNASANRQSLEAKTQKEETSLDAAIMDELA